MFWILLLSLLTFCTPPYENTKHTKRGKTKVVKIEHISRQGEKTIYNKNQSTMPYIEESQEESLFEENDFKTTPSQTSTHPIHQTKLEQQEEIDKLAKLKRSGRLTQKDYSSRIAAMHAKNKETSTLTPVTPPAPTLRSEKEIIKPESHKKEEMKLTIPKRQIPKIEEIIIDDDGDIFSEE